MYYVYMLRCKDNSIYTGITTDLERRMKEHFTRSARCAKYTLTHHARKVECVFIAPDRTQASSLEYAIKHLSRTEKEELISGRTLAKTFNEKKDFHECTRLEKEKFPAVDKYLEMC